MNRKLRRECLGDTSKLCMDVLNRLASCDAWRAGRSFRLRSQLRRACGFCLPSDVRPCFFLSLVACSGFVVCTVACTELDAWSRTLVCEVHNLHVFCVCSDFLLVKSPKKRLLERGVGKQKQRRVRAISLILVFELHRCRNCRRGAGGRRAGKDKNNRESWQPIIS